MQSLFLPGLILIFASCGLYAAPKPIDSISMYLTLHKTKYSLIKISTEKASFSTKNTLYFVFISSLNPGSYYYHVGSKKEFYEIFILSSKKHVNVDWFTINDIESPQNFLNLLKENTEKILNKKISH